MKKRSFLFSTFTATTFIFALGVNPLLAAEGGGGGGGPTTEECHALTNCSGDHTCSEGFICADVTEFCGTFGVTGERCAPNDSIQSENGGEGDNSGGETGDNSSGDTSGGDSAKDDSGPKARGEEHFVANVPTACFQQWFSHNSASIGDESCAKALTRFKFDEANEQNQQIAFMMDAARAAANEAGFDIDVGNCLDLTENMQTRIDDEGKNDKRINPEGEKPDLKLDLVEICRGEDTSDGAEVYQLTITMTNNFFGEESNDAISATTSLLTDEDAQEITRTIDFTGSFGENSTSLQGKVVSDLEGNVETIAINVSNSHSHGAIICTDPKDPTTCVSNSDEVFTDSMTTAINQTFTDGLDSGKITWSDSHQGGTFTNEFNGGWETTGAGCLESTQNFNAAFTSEGGEGEGENSGDNCGPYSKGDLSCEIYKEGRNYAAAKKAEQDLTDCDPETGSCGGSFDCGNPELNEQCDGYCIDGAGLPTEPPSQDRDFSKDTEAVAWLSGCFEGLNFDQQAHEGDFGFDTGDEGALTLKNQEGPPSNMVRKGECWDADGLVATTSSDYSFENRDNRIDPKFNPARNFNNEDKHEFTSEKRCKIEHDPVTGADIREDGSIFCWPDFNTDEAPEGVPLCSKAPEAVRNGEIAPPCAD